MNTMFDKCAVAGDITQAIDRRGCWSVAIVVIGGTESTAVKLQSCETADGSFTDYKELIPASEASADQYKGFVLDLYGAGKFIKVVGAIMATAVLGDCDHDVKKIAITAGEIPSGADLEDNKSATIDVSTYTEPVEITPTAGKDGMKKATVTLSNIPSGGATAYCWVTDREDVNNQIYLEVDNGGMITLYGANDKGFSAKDLEVAVGLSTILNCDVSTVTDYTDNSFVVHARTSTSWSTEVTFTLTRDSSKDITLW